MDTLCVYTNRGLYEALSSGSCGECLVPDYITSLNRIFNGTSYPGIEPSLLASLQANIDCIDPEMLCDTLMDALTDKSQSVNLMIDIILSTILGVDTAI